MTVSDSLTVHGGGSLTVDTSRCDTWINSLLLFLDWDSQYEAFPILSYLPNYCGPALSCYLCNIFKRNMRMLRLRVQIRRNSNRYRMGNLTHNDKTFISWSKRRFLFEHKKIPFHLSSSPWQSLSFDVYSTGILL